MSAASSSSSSSRGSASTSSSPPPVNQPHKIAENLLVELGFTQHKIKRTTFWRHKDLVCNKCDDESLPCSFSAPRRTNQGSVLIPRCERCKDCHKACTLAGKGVKRNWFWGSWSEGRTGLAWLDLGCDPWRSRDEQTNNRPVRQPRLPSVERSLNGYREALAEKDRAAGRRVRSDHLPRQRQVTLIELTAGGAGSKPSSRIYNMVDSFREFRNSLFGDNSSNLGDSDIEQPRLATPPFSPGHVDLVPEDGPDDTTDMHADFPIGDTQYDFFDGHAGRSDSESPSAPDDTPAPPDTSTESTSEMHSTSIEDIESLQVYYKRQMKAYQEWFQQREPYYNFRAHTADMKELYQELLAGGPEHE